MLVEGAGKTHLVLRELMDKLPDSRYPEILLHYTPGAAMYRKDKLIGLLDDDNKKLGEVAAQMVISYFENGIIPTSQDIQLSSLVILNFK